MERSGSFDYILLETTGLADPGNIAPMFWVDDGLGSSIYLDGVVTVVDAKNILTSLDEPAKEDLPTGEEESHTHSHAGPLMTTAHLQISHADVIILNKTDLVTTEQLNAVEERIRSINALARVVHTQHARIPGNELKGSLLDLNAYTTFTEPPPSKGHSHLDPTISTITLTLPAFDVQKLSTLDDFLRGLLWEQDLTEKGYEIHRTKGRIIMTDGSVKVVQGVREIFEIKDALGGSVGGSDNSKLVFIGRGLDKIPGLAALGGSIATK
jgi:G3E family GTPase